MTFQELVVPRINMFRNDWFVVKFLLASLFIFLMLGCASEDVTVESSEATLVEASQEEDKLESTRASVAEWLTENVLSSK